jgi:hypothetical protein
VADIDPIFEQQVFHVSQAQREAGVYQHREADDLGRGTRIAKGLLASWGEAMPRPTLAASFVNHVHLL